MDEQYEYRTIQIERGAWKKVAEHLHGDVTADLERSGAKMFGLWRGEIGFHNDEGIVMSAWPAGTEGGTEVPSVIGSSVEQLVATVRPTDPSPPTDDGIYAHRWFETTQDNWTEFCELSNAAWPYFEGAFPGTRIVGLGRAWTHRLRPCEPCSSPATPPSPCGRGRAPSRPSGSPGSTRRGGASRGGPS